MGTTLRCPEPHFHQTKPKQFLQPVLICHISSPHIISLPTRLMPEHQYCPVLQSWRLGMVLDVFSYVWPMRNTSKQITISAASHPLSLPVQPHICLFTVARLSQLSHSFFSKCKRGGSKVGYSWYNTAMQLQYQLVRKWYQVQGSPQSQISEF